jgi:DNA protecting protein DprA
MNNTMTEFEDIIIHLLCIRGLGPKTIRKILDYKNDNNIQIDTIIGFKTNKIAQLFSVSESVAEEIANYKKTDLYNKIINNEVRLISIHDQAYPRQLKLVLGQAAPPVLFVCGNLQILTKKSVGICGSRHVSEKGLLVTKLCAKALVEKGINITSGYASGVDMTAHISALEHNGTTAIVLAEGILNFHKKSRISKYIDVNNTVIVSEFHPEARWFASNAMQRNKTILGLSKAMLVIESGMKGGTFAAAMDAIRYKSPLFFVDYRENSSSEGNKYFLSKGANAVRANRHGEPNIDGILKAVYTKEDTIISKATQLNLF